MVRAGARADPSRGHGRSRRNRRTADVGQSRYDQRADQDRQETAYLSDAAGRADLEAFFRERIGRLTGGPRNLTQTLETISLCSALREAQAPSLATFLQRYGSKG